LIVENESGYLDLSEKVLEIVRRKNCFRMKECSDALGLSKTDEFFPSPQKKTVLFFFFKKYFPDFFLALTKQISNHFNEEEFQHKKITSSRKNFQCKNPKISNL